MYQEKLKRATQKIIESNSVPRGRIYDRNYNLLVDNVGKKTIYYQKPKGVKTKNEVSLAYELAGIIEVPYNKLYEINLKRVLVSQSPQRKRSKRLPTRNINVTRKKAVVC